jgi:DNA repair protein RadC
MKDLFEVCGECRHLSDAAVIFQVTNNMQTAKEVGRMLAQSDKVTIEDICQTLTPARREMAMAIVELYRRLENRTKDRAVIRCSEDIFKVVRRLLAGLDHEECWVIYMNQANRVIKTQRISTGGLTSTMVDVRLVIREAIRVDAVCMAMVHNHPSGNLHPSADDDRLTQTVHMAAKTLNIRLLDHVIFSDDSYYSYADEGRL